MPDDLGEAETLLADAGYFSAANVEACEKAGIEPLIANERPSGRQPHHPPQESTLLAERFETAPPAPEHPPPVEADVARQVGASAENAGTGVRRHRTGARIASVFGTRGRDRARGAWSLVTMAWNIKRMFALDPV